MSKLDKYITWQCLKFFFLFGSIIVMIFWVNLGARLLDRIFQQGYSAVVFLEIFLLSLPPIGVQVIPMASFAASLYLANQLRNDNELTVMSASGMSPARIIKPFLIFGFLTFFLTLLLTNFLTPLSSISLIERYAAMSKDIVTRALKEREFVHPIDGVTIYMKNIYSDGLIQDVFISDNRSDTFEIVGAASSANVITDGDGGIIISMNDGILQRKNKVTGVLSIIDFSTMAYNMSDLFDLTSITTTELYTLPTQKLFFPSEDLLKTLKVSKSDTIIVGHTRISAALLALASTFVGASIMLIGAHSRYGFWALISLAVVVGVVVQMISAQSITPAMTSLLGWPSVYLGPISATIIGVVFIWLAQLRIDFNISRFSFRKASQKPGLTT